MKDIMAERQQDVLYDVKWQKFLSRTWLFRYIPFIDLVFGSGSMALGNITEVSDFDALIGTRSHRIFTARLCAAIAFSLFGWRRTKMDHRAGATDKICLNHFVAPANFCLSVPPNEYWQRLYKSLVPVYGSVLAFKQFFGANKKWLGAAYEEDLRHRHQTPSIFKRGVEKILSGWFGNWIERRAKAFQVRRIRAGLQVGAGKSGSHTIVLGNGSQVATYRLPPLIRYDDNELQFHPDPAVIEIMK